LEGGGIHDAMDRWTHLESDVPGPRRELLLFLLTGREETETEYGGKIK